MLDNAFCESFPALWEQFEQLLKKQFRQEFTAKKLREKRPFFYELKELYHTVGWKFWHQDPCAYRWVQQFESMFFENRHYDTERLLYHYEGLDDLAAKILDTIVLRHPEWVWSLAVKPQLDARKRELVAALTKLKEEQQRPIEHKLVIPTVGQEPCRLGFRTSRQKRAGGTDLTGYAYTLNGRKYTDIRAFCEKTLEELPGDVDIRQDIYGERCLSVYTSVPTFDSSDREWDSRVLDFLVFDGKDIHLIVMRGGYKIASLTFYETLLSADIRLKPLFEKMGWPTEKLLWIEGIS